MFVNLTNFKIANFHSGIKFHLRSTSVLYDFHLDFIVKFFNDFYWDSCGSVRFYFFYFNFRFASDSNLVKCILGKLILYLIFRVIVTGLKDPTRYTMVELS